MGLKRVYVSGPLSDGGRLDLDEQMLAVERAMDAAQDLIDAGYAPLNPHLTLFHDQYLMDEGRPTNDHATWLSVDRPWVLASDAVLRLPGSSEGADREVAWARGASIPVFHSVEALKLGLPEGGTETTLEEALRLVVKDRGQAYGLPEDDFARTAGMLNALFAKHLREPFKPADIAKLMICVKLSRSMVSTRRDHYVDVAGYAATGHRCDFGEW